MDYKKILISQFTFLHDIINSMINNLSGDTIMSLSEEIRCIPAYSSDVLPFSDVYSINEYIRTFDRDLAEITDSPFLTFKYKEATVCIESCGDDNTYVIRCQLSCLDDIMFGGSLTSVIEAINQVPSERLEKFSGIYWDKYIN